MLVTASEWASRRVTALACPVLGVNTKKLTISPNERNKAKPFMILLLFSIFFPFL
jgi:hypothetical protein